MSFNVNEFSAQMALDGARSTLFRVDMSNPVNNAGDPVLPFMCRGAQIPGGTINPILVPYFGRQIKLAGNRTYAEWQTTIFNDEDYRIRNAIEQWSHAINSPEGNLRAFNSSSASLYKSTAEVTQLSKTGVPLRVYKLIGIWPQDIQPIELNWEGEGIQETMVTWSFDYWVVSGGVTGNAGGSS